MSTVPPPDVAEPPRSDSTEERFRLLAAAWEADTLYLSDAHRIIEHPAFQEIIRMGDAVVPLLLRELEKKPSHWVWALSRITGAHPVAQAEGGNIRKMTDAW